MSNQVSLSYRTDIDGLRAIAVLAVLVFHLASTALPGGFAGVDLFFVISGYVISRIIYTSIVEKKFSLRDFYLRRTRRLLPAITVLLLITLVTSYFILPPAAFREMSASVTAVVFFVANIFFWFSSDYFSVTAELKPLLHCWTLSVEEQLYVFFPLILLWSAAKSRRLASYTVCITLLLSLASCIYLTKTHEIAAFFLMPTRAWEFLLGTVVAMGMLPRLDNRVIRELITVTGLILVVTAFLFMHERLAFPGYWALWPCLGCTLILYGGENGESRTAGILQLAPLRYIGRISYSLYLWHWPLIAFANNLEEGELSLLLKLFLGASAIVMGSLSYHFVEQPFRQNKRVMAWLTIRKGAAVAVLLGFLGVLGYLYAVSGDSERKTLRQQGHEQEPVKAMTPGDVLKVVSTYMPNIKLCSFDDISLESLERCSFGDLESEKIFLLWGDSHSMVMMPTLTKIAGSQGWRGILALSAGCPPLFGVHRLDGAGSAAGCTGELARKVNSLLLTGKIDLVILVSRWTLYEKGYYVKGRLQKATHFLSDDQLDSYDSRSSIAVLKRAIPETIEVIAGDMKIPVMVLLNVPELPKAMGEMTPDTIVQTRGGYEAYRQVTADIIRPLGSLDRVTVLDPIDIFCKTGQCRAYDGSIALYGDDNHVSPAGSEKMLSLFQRAFDKFDN